MRVPEPSTVLNPTLKGHKVRILSPWGIPSDFIPHLRKRFPDLDVHALSIATPWNGGKGAEYPRDGWEDVTVLLTAIQLPVLNDVPRLEYVQMSSAGVNFILDHPLFKDTQIPFCSANGVHGPQISEWIVATFLMNQHRIPKYLDAQREAKWKRDKTTLVRDSVGQRVGILGYGSIGRQVARVATAMGMEVYAYTLHPKTTPEAKRDHSYAPPGLGDPEGTYPSKWFSGETTDDLHTFLRSGLDLLVISVPLTEKTKGIIGTPEFEILSEQKTFVSNVGRGPIIKTDDLIAALDGDLIRGAALDVTDPEPLPDGHPLWSAKNLIITPHVSGGSVNYASRVLAILETNLVRLSEGKTLLNQVSRKEGY